MTDEKAVNGFHLALRILDRLGVKYDNAAVFAHVRDQAALGEIAVVDAAHLSGDDPANRFNLRTIGGVVLTGSRGRDPRIRERGIVIRRR